MRPQPVCCPNPLCQLHDEPWGVVSSDRETLYVGIVAIRHKVTVCCRLCKTPYTWWPPIKRKPQPIDINAAPTV